MGRRARDVQELPQADAAELLAACPCFCFSAVKSLRALSRSWGERGLVTSLIVPTLGYSLALSAHAASNRGGGDGETAT